MLGAHAIVGYETHGFRVLACSSALASGLYEPSWVRGAMVGGSIGWGVAMCAATVARMAWLWRKAHMAFAQGQSVRIVLRKAMGLTVGGNAGGDFFRKAGGVWRMVV